MRALMLLRTTPNSMFGTADQLMVSVLLASADLSISTHRHLEALFQRSIKMMMDTGLAFMLGDSAAGYAALSLMPEGREVMTVEMKINLLAPAIGDTLEAIGEVVRAGRRLTVVRAEVFALTGDTRKSVALLQGTMIPVDPA